MPNDTSFEVSEGAARPWLRLACFLAFLGGFWLLGSLGSDASAGTVLRSCNALVCDEYLYFDADPGESNEIYTGFGQRYGRGRYYWVGDDNNVIHLGQADGFFHGNGCEHPEPGEPTDITVDMPRSHIVRCRWGSDGRVSFRLGDRDDEAVVFGGRSRGAVTVGGPGDDRIIADWLIEGGAGDDFLMGGTDHGVLRGGDGRDTLNGDYGADDLHGGDGYDTVAYTGSPGSVRVTVGDGRQNDGGRCDAYEHTPGGCDGPAFDRSDEVSGDVEKVIGTAYDDTLVGDDGADTFEGRGGDDRIRGGGGDDTLWGGGRRQAEDGTVLVYGGFNDLNGGDGNDVLIGGIDSDSLLGGPGNDDLRGEQSMGYEATDFLNGGGGNDLLNAGDNPYMETGAPSMDLISGGTGLDTADYRARSADLSITLDDVNDDGQVNKSGPGEQDGVASDVENILSGIGNDLLWGSPIDNVLEGADGDDTFIGGLGADDFVGGPGTDAVSYEDRSNPVKVTIDDTFDDGETFLVDDRTASEGDRVGIDIETLIGGSGGDELFGGKSPAATIFGGLGNDIIGGGPGPDLLDGQDGDDTIYSMDSVKEDVIGGEGKDSAQVDEFDAVTEVESFF